MARALSDIKNALADRILVVDGAMGTSIQNWDLSAEAFGGPDYEGCNEYLNVISPEIVESIHQSFLEAGADIIETNTFNANAITAAAGIATLKIVATGEPQRKADHVAQSIRAGFDEVLEERGVNAVVHGDSSAFHVYFGARSTNGLGAKEIKGMPGDVMRAYRQGLQMRGIDLMSRAGGLTSMMHTDEDIQKTIVGFGLTIDEMLRNRVISK